MKKIAFIFSVPILCAATAFADQPQYTSGMKYTTMRPAQADDADKKPVYNRARPAKAEAPEEEVPREVEKTPEQTVWDKYKALAAGQTEKQGNGQATPEAPAKPQKPSRSSETTTKAETGIAGIIQEYQRNKQKRSQMQSMTFTKPEIPTAEKPEIE